MNKFVRKLDTLSGWKLTKFEDVCKISQGLQIAISKRKKQPNESTYPYITNQWVNSQDISDEYYIENPPNSVLCTKDDILMTRTGNTGIPLTDVSGVYHNNFFKINYDRSIIDKVFFFNLLKTNYIQHEIAIRAGTSTIPDLNHSDFYSIEFLKPPVNEQSMIAEILSAWDEAIALQESLINEKEKHSQGLIKQILSKDYLSWNKYKFGNVFDFVRTYTFSRAQLIEKNGDDKLLNIHYGDIHATYEGQTLDLVERDQVPRVKELKKKIPEEDYIKEGDLIIADASEDYEGVGACVEMVNTDGKKITGGLHTFVVRDKEKITALGFKPYMLLVPKINKRLKQIATGTSVYGLSKSELSKVEVYLPDLTEQEKLVELFSTLEEEIQLQKQKLKLLKLQKKGLMQVLLTGRVRVKA